MARSAWDVLDTSGLQQMVDTGQVSDHDLPQVLNLLDARRAPDKGQAAE